MKISKQLLVFLVLSFSFILRHETNQAATFCVDTAVSLQSAMDIAVNNGDDDIIRISRGTYEGEFRYESFEEYSLTIEGGYDTDCITRLIAPDTTVLDGNNIARVMLLKTDQKTNLIVEGLKIVNGSMRRSNKNLGGGLLIETRGEVTLNNNIIGGNIASSAPNSHIPVGGSGGGIFIAYASTVNITNTIIHDNVARHHGGGVYIIGATTVTLSNNTICENVAGDSAVGTGGGIYMTDIKVVNIMGNSICNNSSIGGTIHGGGGIWIADTIILTMINNTVVGNLAGLILTRGGGGQFRNIEMLNFINNTFSSNISRSVIYIGLFYDTAMANMYNNIIWDNASNLDMVISMDGDRNGILSEINLFNNNFNFRRSLIRDQNFFPLPIDDSNLDNVDPLFIDTAGGNYRLRADSPVINRGTNDAPGIPDTDKDGNPRVLDGVVDMGAYEFAN